MFFLLLAIGYTVHSYILKKNPFLTKNLKLGYVIATGNVLGSGLAPFCQPMVSFLSFDCL